MNLTPSFSGPIRVEEIPGDNTHWMLLDSCTYFLDTPYMQLDEWVDVPKGFVTDFGSIPQIFWNLPGLSPNGKYRRAYVVHDKLYRAPVVRRPGTARAITRQEADNILGTAMRALGAGKFIRGLIVSTLGQFGQAAWDNYRRQEALGISTVQVRGV